VESPEAKTRKVDCKAQNSLPSPAPKQQARLKNLLKPVDREEAEEYKAMLNFEF
jgi:hypothetical protein